MRSWRKQDTAYLGATVTAVALAASATFGFSPGESGSIHINDVARELAAPFVASLPQIRTNRVVTTREVVLRIPTPGRTIVVVTSKPTQTTDHLATSPPPATAEPTPAPVVVHGRALGKAKNAARSGQVDALARR